MTYNTNEVRERLDAAANLYTINSDGCVPCSPADIRALLDDHARLMAENLLLAKGHRWQDGEWSNPQPASQSWADIERAAVARYRPVPDGPFSYRVVAGDGDRSLYTGTKDECHRFARKLTEAFLDGSHVAYETVLAIRADHAQPAPAIDLGQFRQALEHARLSIMSAEKREEIERLLALIDGQGQPPITLTDEMVERACAAFTAAGRRERALPSLSPRWMREALESALQPTKGEGER